MHRLPCTASASKTALQDVTVIESSRSRSRHLAICSQVDYDDEGWFAGTVELVAVEGDGRTIYQVRLDVGEMADDVEGSEIRSERRPEAKDGSIISSGGRDIDTRADSLSGFEILDSSGDNPSEVNSEVSTDGEALPHAKCRLTEAGVEWSFIDDGQFNWSPLTAAALKAHEARFPRWMEVKAAAPPLPVAGTQFSEPSEMTAESR